MSEVSQDPGSIQPEVKPHIVQGERIPQTEVAAVAEDFGSFYGLSPEIIGKAKKAEAYYVSETEFAQAIKEQVHDDVEWSMRMDELYKAEPNSFEHIAVELDKEDLQKTMNDSEQFGLIAEQITQEKSRSTVGRAISKPDGRELIVLKNTISPKNRRRILEHEMVHVLASSGFEGGTGFAFYHPILGYLNIPLNEGATEILRLNKSYPNVSPAKLSQALSEEPGSLYSHEARKVLTILGMTNLSGGSPFSIKDLARHYFFRRESKLVDKSDALIQDIEQHVAERYRKGVRSLVENVLHEEP